MAGSYRHAVNDDGQLRHWRHMPIAAENKGDAYETIEEFYGMVWYLANGDPARVEEARQRYEEGIAMSPGRESEPRPKPEAGSEKRWLPTYGWRADERA